MIGSEDRYSIPRSNLRLIDYNEIASNAYSKNKVVVDLSDGFILFRRIVDKVSNRIPEHYDIHVEELNDWSIHNLFTPNSYIDIFKFSIESIIKSCKESIPLPCYFVDLIAAELETFHDNLLIGCQLYEVEEELTPLLINIYALLTQNVLADTISYSPYHWIDTDSKISLTFVKDSIERIPA